MWVGQTYYFTWLDGQFGKLEKEAAAAKTPPAVWMVHSGGFYAVEKQNSLGGLPGLVHWVRLEALMRSEERRVGEEGRVRWSPDHLKKKKKVCDDLGSLVARQSQQLDYHDVRGVVSHREPDPLSQVFASLLAAFRFALDPKTEPTICEH